MELPYLMLHFSSLAFLHLAYSSRFTSYGKSPLLLNCLFYALFGIGSLLVFLLQKGEVYLYGVSLLVPGLYYYSCRLLLEKKEKLSLLPFFGVGVLFLILSFFFDSLLVPPSCVFISLFFLLYFLGYTGATLVFLLGGPHGKERNVRILSVGMVAGSVLTLSFEILLPFFQLPVPRVAAFFGLFWILSMQYFLQRESIPPFLLERVALDAAENTKEGILLLDKEGRIRRANPVALNLLGEEVPYREFSAVLTGGHFLFAREKASREWTSSILQGKSAIPASFLVTRIQKGDAFLGYLVLLRDERKEVEKSTRREELSVLREEEAVGAARLAKLGSRRRAFMSQLAGQVRAPLNLLLGFSQILSHRYEEAIAPLMQIRMDRKFLKDVDSLRNSLEIVEFEAKQLQSFLRDVLEGKTPESLFHPDQATAFCLADVVEEAVENVGKYPPAITLFQELAPNLPPLQGERAPILRVVQKLLRNAIRCTPDGAVTICVYVEESFVCLCVEDTGRGIDELQLQSIFLPPKKEEGFTLYHCQEILGQYGGTLRVESTLGEGSRFSFCLPTGL